MNARSAAVPAPLVLLGGTFDPVHYGHLGLADDVRTALALPEVRLVPAGDPAHREAPRASAHDRVAMLALAVREFPGLVVDTREIVRPGKTYTVDTLAELRAEVADRPLAVLMGADVFRGLPAWHRWNDVFRLAHLIVVPRPGTDIGVGLPDALAKEWDARRSGDPKVLRSLDGGSIYVQPVTARAISSSAIREKLARGEAKSVEIAGLLPPAVLAYIQSNGLYSHLPHAR
jgi:nicotinate-nucleotide adenylyltransferase